MDRNKPVGKSGIGWGVLLREIVINQEDIFFFLFVFGWDFEYFRF